ncbi:hypothetical protein [Labrys miyagiensis]|uniref:hypothetical protein n=1 Tax=Labrys miyagiensis TaxID=346912 RepID=UPI0024E1290E|nr:hypothetical protein [Labrys miyagiensis]
MAVEPKSAAKPAARRPVFSSFDICSPLHMRRAVRFEASAGAKRAVAPCSAHGSLFMRDRQWESDELVAFVIFVPKIEDKKPHGITAGFL